MAVERGKLVLTNKGKPVVEIEGKRFNPAAGEISQTILDYLDEFNGKDVEFERVGGQPKKVREVGGTFVAPTRAQRSPSRRGPRNQPWQRPGPDSRRRATQGPTSRKRDFHNPYNFVPAPPRKVDDPDLGDHPPPPQDAFRDDRYTGWIRVCMTVETPLLVFDTERVREDPNSGHKTFPLRVDAQGRPLLPPSSIRGMLRAAYEAITNSRFGRFSYEQHKDRLAFRMEAKEGLRLVPARIQGGQIHLLTGTSKIGQDGQASGPLYAAWLPRYNKNGRVGGNAVRYPDGKRPQHGDEVVCWVERIEHSKPHFEFWRVRAIAPSNNPDALGPQPEPSEPTRKTRPVEPAQFRKVRGWVCITNANINRKHDERVFFAASGNQCTVDLTDDIRRAWRELIANYQAIHAEDLAKRRKEGKRPDEYLGPEPGRTAWSRHVYDEQALELRDGTLCYARLDSNGNVEALFPVTISRELYEVSPWDLLHPTLRPAARIEELSPADRVFGWVFTDAPRDRRPAKGRPVAVRGLLRVGPVRCLGDAADAVETFEPDSVPLAILSSPKPQQGRFYVAKSPMGEAQEDGLTKQKAGYARHRGLRGRKVYPHHKGLPDGYWDTPLEDRTQKPVGGARGHYQEYRRPRDDERREQRDDQNCSVLAWVRPGTRFAFDLDVLNLSAVELGALLWLLELPDGHFFRLGHGKPLGFGSVRLNIEALDVRRGGQGLAARYAAWHEEEEQNAVGDPRETLREAYRQAVVRAYGQSTGSFQSVPFIAAFLRACQGFDDSMPVHYPRATPKGIPGPPSPKGESFKWFVANERSDARYSLPDLVKDRGLPTLPEKSNSR